MLAPVQAAGEPGEIRRDNADAAVGCRESLRDISFFAGDDDIKFRRIPLRQRPAGSAQGGGEEPAVRCEYKGGSQITVPLTSGRPWLNRSA